MSGRRKVRREREREREEVRNERMKVMKGKNGDRQKRLFLQRGLGPGLSVSAKTSTLQMTEYTHKHTLTQLWQSSTEPRLTFF